MADREKLTLLRKVLRTIGLPPDAVDDLVDRVVDLLSEKPSREPKFPYHLRDDFLSPAEHNFYLVLKEAVRDKAVICPKASLGDLFYAKSSDYGEYLTYTNKIDRKHVDFLLCHPRTIKPMVGIELDDGSHGRADRKERDDFVEKVYAAARLPLLRVPVRHAYNIEELRELIRQAARGNTTEQPIEKAPEAQVPVCPECGSAMVLRTAKKGPNRGGRFWGCSEYPRCRGIVQVEARST